MREKKYIPTEKRSYNKLYFVLSVIFFLVTIWSWCDEMIVRRPWKKYQTQYFKHEYQKAETEFKNKGEKLIARREELIGKKNRIEKGLKKDKEYSAILDKLKETELRLFEVSQEQKFAKSRLDEAYYFYKHALHEGEEWEAKKAKVEEIERKVQGFNPAITELKSEIDTLNTKINSFTQEKRALEKELTSVTAELDLLNLKMQNYRPTKLFYKIPEVKQVVIKGLAVNNFGEPLLKVDRCQSCHVSYADKSYTDAEHPFKTHPNLEILIKNHKTEKFGCTICHKGQGPAISSVKLAHGMVHEGDQTIGLNEPLLKGDFLQSNCRNCHDTVMQLNAAPVLSRGKQLFVKLGCHGCHLVAGYENLDKVAPRLRKIGSKVNPSWLYRWVKKPKDYLPATRMPFFNLSDEDALAVTAYLINSSDKDYSPPFKYEWNGSVTKGQELFRIVGCMGCHSVKGKGGKFAPDLSRIASKVNTDWLFSWLHNPKQYNDKTIMPSLRLSEQEAADLTAYLLTLGKKEEISALEEKIKLPEQIKKGELVIKRRGCFACHEINGMEKEGRIAPELTTFGIKRLLELEFGDAKIEHSWEAWARTKLKNPSAYRTERVLDKMPNFSLSDEEINSLMVFLKSLNGSVIPKQFQRILSPAESEIEKGRRLVRKFNCVGCHIIEGKGGLIARFYERVSEAPPLLEKGELHEGEKVQGAWLFAFLKKPRTIRPWLKVRMPTFYFTDEDVTALTRYFASLAKSESIYDYIEQRKITKEEIISGRKLVSRDYFDCFNCHVRGDKFPEGPPEGWAPDLSKARRRLRPDWIIKWLKNPQKLQPGTKMPTYFEDEDSGPDDIFEGDEQRQIEAIMEYIMALGEGKG